MTRYVVEQICCYRTADGIYGSQWLMELSLGEKCPPTASQRVMFGGFSSEQIAGYQVGQEVWLTVLPKE